MFERVEHRVVIGFGRLIPQFTLGLTALVFLDFLTFFAQLLGQVGGHLGGITLIEMLHQAFGHFGAAVIHRSGAEIDVKPVSEMLK